MRVPTLTIVALAGIAAGLAGCNGTAGGNAGPGAAADPTVSAIQDSAAANGLGADLSELGPEVVADGETAATTARSAGAATGPRIVDLATLLRPDGSRRFPNTTGSVTVDIQGSSAFSAPMGSVRTGSWTVAVILDQGDVVCTDPVSGATATMAGGSGDAAPQLQYALDTSFSASGPRTWTLEMHATSAIQPALAVSVVRPGSAARSWTIAGQREVAQVRSRGPDPATQHDVSRVVRTIGGAATGIDAAAPDDGYTSWLVARGDGRSLQWNRRARYAWGYDHTARARLSADAGDYDRIYIAIDGADRRGPYTPAQVAAIFRIRHEPDAL